MRNNSRFLLACLWLWPGLLPAVQVDDLYVAQVLVSSQSEIQRRIGARAGLLQVLVRVSGDSEVERNPIIATALNAPENYYSEFSYESTEQTLLIGDEELPARLLRIGFEPGAVARLLRDTGYPVWGSNRPSVLVWVALDNGMERELVREDDSTELVEALIDGAWRRGVPLIYPLFDLEDAAALSTAEVWGGFFDRVEQASGRYGPDTLLMGRVYREVNGEWSGRWSFQVDGEWLTIENFAVSQRDLVTDVINQLADMLAQRYAIDSSRGSVWLSVDAVDSVADYAAVSAYLQSLAPVLDTFVVRVEGANILFRLSTEGQNEQLVEIIALDQRMVLVGPVKGTSEREPLYYRWLE